MSCYFIDLCRCMILKNSRVTVLQLIKMIPYVIRGYPTQKDYTYHMADPVLPKIHDRWEQFLFAILYQKYNPYHQNNHYVPSLDQK